MLEIRKGLKIKSVFYYKAVVASCSDIDKVSTKDWEAWRFVGKTWSRSRGREDSKSRD